MPSKLELTFCAVPKGTEIVMVHSNVPKDQKDETAEGWTEFYGEPLKEYFKKQSKVTDLTGLIYSKVLVLNFFPSSLHRSRMRLRPIKQTVFNPIVPPAHCPTM